VSGGCWLAPLDARLCGGSAERAGQQQRWGSRAVAAKGQEGGRPGAQLPWAPPPTGLVYMRLSGSMTSGSASMAGCPPTCSRLGLTSR
jgi:hypothetical protein